MADSTRSDVLTPAHPRLPEFRRRLASFKEGIGPWGAGGCNCEGKSTKQTVAILVKMGFDPLATLSAWRLIAPCNCDCQILQEVGGESSTPDSVAFEKLEHLYRESKNPLHAWVAVGIAADTSAAMGMAAAAGIAWTDAETAVLPAWVLEYLGHVSREMLNWAYGKPPSRERRPGAIFEILGFREPGPGRKPDAFDAYADPRDRLMANRLHFLRLREHLSHDAAREKVMTEYGGVSRSVVDRAWQDYAPGSPNNPADSWDVINPSDFRD